ncbi:RBBP9/YdeN family alpha/beta hydrolase [Flavobacterium restrictum]|uniref:Serine hydrolase family protein n=1 Tax=Flavobacterium restrictum TaxID=2594428 RepID=A0A553E3V0_9FLAO|nr:alpha/beta hydrolase [Flavobacterium restrictum]TRX39707.1 serine hydrolase family protein [Flavobacterium restrictum]
MIPHLLIIPGLGDSGEKHWQHFWLQKFPNATKVVQDNWNEPQLDQWLNRLTQTIHKLDQPTILVAHSLAVSLVLHWVAQNSNPNIIGALLVAPADVDSPDHTPDFLRNFAPIPTDKLPFPAIVIGTENDTYCAPERVQFLAKKWGSTFINIGYEGHINSDSDLAFWEEGQQFLNQLIAQINPTK